MTASIASRFRTALVLATLGALSVAAQAETLDQLYEKAKAEKALAFYAGGPAAPHEDRAKAFMQRFPGISVSVAGGFSTPPQSLSFSLRLPPDCCLPP